MKNNTQESIVKYISRRAFNAYCKVKNFLAPHLRPYTFRPEKFKHTFLDNTSTTPDRELKGEPVPRVIYCFWTGNNPLTPNRKAGLASLKQCAGVEVKLITPENWGEYIVESDPLPEAFQYLSLNHKSDYLRSYFMYHHGGGYADIKFYDASWVNAFEKLEKSNAYAIAPRELDAWSGPKQSDHEDILNTLHKFWYLQIINTTFICRAKTKLTEEWHNEAKRRLLAHSEQLKAHPATDFFAQNKDYPLRWEYLQGEIFNAVCLKYNKQLLFYNAIRPLFKAYR